MNIEEGNILLAEFLKFEKTDLQDSFCKTVYRLPECIGNFMLCSHWGHLMFYNDWRWLMAVVIKIEELKQKNNSTPQFKVFITKNTCMILDTFESEKVLKQDFLDLYFDFRESKQATVWNACVKFVIWYNFNKNLYE